MRSSTLRSSFCAHIRRLFISFPPQLPMSSGICGKLIQIAIDFPQLFRFPSQLPIIYPISNGTEPRYRQRR
jgi:hypothetical protein